jgi:hypothetical protein
MFGAEQMPAPLVALHRRGDERPTAAPTYVGKAEGGVRYVGLAPDKVRILARVAGGRTPRAVRRAPRWDRRHMRREWTRTKNDLTTTLLHEWAHVFQDPMIPNMILIREPAASLFASWAARQRIKGFMRRDGSRAQFRPTPSYPDECRELRQTHPPSYWQREQFGVLWGANPRKPPTEPESGLAAR